MKIKNLAIVSTLGRGAVFNAAAMRCKYDGFVTEKFGQVGELNTARLSLDKKVSDSRVVTLLVQTIEDAIAKMRLENVALYLCLNDEFSLYDKSHETMEFFNILKKKVYLHTLIWNK